MQSIVDTVARSLLSLVWELISRVLTTFMLFGIFESVCFYNYCFGNIVVTKTIENNECFIIIIISLIIFKIFFDFSGFADLKHHLIALYLEFPIEQHPDGDHAGEVRYGHRVRGAPVSSHCSRWPRRIRNTGGRCLS